MFTINTETGEMAWVLDLKISGTTMSSWVAGTGRYPIGTSPRNVCRNGWETVVL
jgi:hypothetical protein